MTCEEHCLHWEVCKLTPSEYATAKYYTFCKCAEKCECFKDKSKYIELPCKVGDTVYYIKDYNSERKIFTLCCNMIFIRNDGNYVQLMFPDNRTSKSFNFINFGHCLFLTKAEAEAKLKELNENG